MRYAYVTFLIRNDGYLPGALTLAYTLRLQTSYDLVCLVTDDISYKAREALRLLYDYVIPVAGIRARSSVIHGRSDRDLLLSRFEALKLGRDGDLGIGYDKIILLDADVLPVRDFDKLFELKAPAGIIMESKSGCYSDYNEVTGMWGWHRLYDEICPHGAPIPSHITSRVRDDKNNMGVNAGLWLLEPSMKGYGEILACLDEPETAMHITNFPWPEMQLATMLWSGEWTSVDIRYCSIGGYPRPELLHGMHFAGLKPWQIRSRSIEHYAAYPDFRLWYACFAAMYWSLPELRGCPALKRLWEFCWDKMS